MVIYVRIHPNKFNGRGLQGISMICGGLILWIGSPTEAISQCALCILC
ncbi:DUF3693 domain-containing protein [Vibrio tetraodonis]